MNTFYGYNGFVQTKFLPISLLQVLSKDLDNKYVTYDFVRIGPIIKNTTWDKQQKSEVCVANIVARLSRDLLSACSAQYFQLMFIEILERRSEIRGPTKSGVPPVVTVTRTTAAHSENLTFHYILATRFNRYVEVDLRIILGITAGKTSKWYWWGGTPA